MTAKEFLSQGLILQKKINEKNSRLECLKSRAEKITVSFGYGTATLSNGNDREKLIAEIIDLDNEIVKDVKEFVSKRNEIAQFIELVNNENCRKVLEYRYIMSFTWTQISEVMNYSQSHIFRFYRQSIDILNKIAKNESKFSKKVLDES